MLQFVIACGVIEMLWNFLPAARSARRSAARNACRNRERHSRRQSIFRPTISHVGLVGIVWRSFCFSAPSGGYRLLVGAVLRRGGYVGMLISVRANVRTTGASRQGLAQGLSISSNRHEPDVDG